MMGLEEFIKMFGFTKQSDVIAIICMVVLLGNFLGGLMSNIVLAHTGAISKRKLTEKTSFRLALVSELMVIIYAVYYHAALVSTIDAAQALLWVFTLIAAPLLAAFGAQISYLMFKNKIDEAVREGEARAAATGDDDE